MAPPPHPRRLGLPRSPHPHHAGALHQPLPRQALQLRLPRLPQPRRPAGHLETLHPEEIGVRAHRRHDDGARGQRQRPRLPPPRLRLLHRTEAGLSLSRRQAREEVRPSTAMRPPDAPTRKAVSAPRSRRRASSDQPAAGIISMRPPAPSRMAQSSGGRPARAQLSAASRMLSASLSKGSKPAYRSAQAGLAPEPGSRPARFFRRDRWSLG
jgi:hypothetical protein